MALGGDGWFWAYFTDPQSDFTPATPGDNSSNPNDKEPKT